MLQNIIYKMSSPDEKNKKEEGKPKIKNMRSVDRNGNIVHRPIHRREFKRSTALRKVSTGIGNLRHYYDDEKVFNELLVKYNMSEQQTMVQLIQTKTVFMYGGCDEETEQQQQQQPPLKQQQSQKQPQKRQLQTFQQQHQHLLQVPQQQPQQQQMQNQQQQQQQQPKEVSHKFKGCGCMNVRMRLCSRCGDEEKTHESEPYYVDMNEVSSWRTIFCYGCMGQLLRAHHEFNMEEFK